MADQLLLALAQLNPCVGDLSANAAKLLDVWKRAKQQNADLLIASELYLTGYPLEDMALKPALLEDARKAVMSLAKETAEGPAILMGAPWVEGDYVYNAVLLLEGGKIIGQVYKHDLPNYGPFDEQRVYVAGPLPQPIIWRGHKLGVIVCEDMWTGTAAAHLRRQGAQIQIVVNGSPYETNKHRQRLSLARDRVQETGLPLVYVNQIGGQDELVFDGASFVMSAAGEIVHQAKAWEQDLILSSWAVNAGVFKPVAGNQAAIPEGEAAIYHVLVVGLRDYVEKNGFKQVLLGLSGGIDSALVAAIAVDALGADKVHTVMMPSPHTSQESLDDAIAIAKILKCQLDTISITAAMQVFEKLLSSVFANKQQDITEENIQSRCRGLILMGISNKNNAMVLATGNKSEMSVGYTTLYGDMCGGYAPLKDVYKTIVYAISRWRNTNKPSWALGPDCVVIPERVLIKAPTAELRPNQKDQDSLPSYDVLDDILECLIEYEMKIPEIIGRGHDKAIIKQVQFLLDRAEYKRRQAPPGPKITRRHLSRDRRYPITNRYKEN